jgi:hypothetical protein
MAWRCPNWLEPCLEARRRLCRTMTWLLHSPWLVGCKNGSISNQQVIDQRTSDIWSITAQYQINIKQLTHSKIRSSCVPAFFYAWTKAVCFAGTFSATRKLRSNTPVNGFQILFVYQKIEGYLDTSKTASLLRNLMSNIG